MKQTLFLTAILLGFFQPTLADTSTSGPTQADVQSVLKRILPPEGFEIRFNGKTNQNKVCSVIISLESTHGTTIDMELEGKPFLHFQTNSRQIQTVENNLLKATLQTAHLGKDAKKPELIETAIFSFNENKILKSVEMIEKTQKIFFGKKHSLCNVRGLDHSAFPMM